MNISSVIRLESCTSKENFDKKSMSFYGFNDINDMGWLMGQKEILLVHTVRDTADQRTIVINGMRLFNQLEYRTYKKKPVIIYRYQ